MPCSPRAGSRPTPGLAARTASSRSAPPRTSCCTRTSRSTTRAGCAARAASSSMVLAELEARLRSRCARCSALEPPRPIERRRSTTRSVFDRQFTGLFRFPAAGFYARRDPRARRHRARRRALARAAPRAGARGARRRDALDLRLPGWLNEGLAEWFEARTSGKRVSASASCAVLAHSRSRGSSTRSRRSRRRASSGFGRERRVARLSPVLRLLDYLVAPRRRARARAIRRGAGAQRAISTARCSACSAPISASSRRASRPSSASVQRMLPRRARAVVAAFLAALLAGCGDDPARARYPARGVVRDGAARRAPGR